MRIKGQNKKMTAKKMLKRPEMKQLIEKVKMLSPFELKDEFIKMAQKGVGDPENFKCRTWKSELDSGNTKAGLLFTRTICRS